MESNQNYRPIWHLTHKLTPKSMSYWLFHNIIFFPKEKSNFIDKTVKLSIVFLDPSSTSLYLDLALINLNYEFPFWANLNNVKAQNAHWPQKKVDSSKSHSIPYIKPSKPSLSLISLHTHIFFLAGNRYPTLTEKKWRNNNEKTSRV